MAHATSPLESHLGFLKMAAETKIRQRVAEEIRPLVQKIVDEEMVGLVIDLDEIIRFDDGDSKTILIGIRPKKES